MVGGGRSATAAAAYRAGGRVCDQTTGETFDYTRRRGVAGVGIVLPAGAARWDVQWAHDREALWNAAERAECRSNARVARVERHELVRAFAAWIADRYGVAVDFALHTPHRAGDERNHHARLLATTRVIGPGGLGEKAPIEWSDANRRKAGLGPAREEVLEVRACWASLMNGHLRLHGIEGSVDHRSLRAQGVRREPGSHLGPAVSGMERRGIETEVGKRLVREALEAAQRKLERAAELGQVEREERALAASIIDVSGNLAAAKRARERMRSRSPVRSPGEREGREPNREPERSDPEPERSRDWDGPEPG